jgi:hypothetical protein
LSVPPERLDAVRKLLSRLDVCNHDAVCKTKVTLCLLSNYMVPTCLPGVISAYEKGKPKALKLHYPSLTQINEGFNAVVTKNLAKKPDVTKQPLF